MDQKAQIKQLLNKAKKIRSQTSINGQQLQHYINYQKQRVDNDKPFRSSFSKCCSKPIYSQKSFRQAFANLSQKQKTEFYLMNLEIIQDLSNQNQNRESLFRNQNQMDLLKKESYNNIQSKAFVKFQKSDKKWMQATLSIFIKENLLKVQQYKIQVDLQKCLMRKSGSKKQISVVIIPLRSHQQLRVKENPIQSMNIYLTLAKAWRKAQQDKIRRMMVGIRSQKKQKSKSNEDQRASEQSTKKILNFNKIKNQQKISVNNQIPFEEPNQQQFDITNYLENIESLKDYEKKFGQAYYHKDGKKVKKIFRFPSETPKAFLLSIIKEPIHIKKRIPSIQSLKIIKNLPMLQKNIYHHIDKIKKRKVQFLYMRHYIQKNSEEEYFVDRSLNHKEVRLTKLPEVNQGWIQYCIWRIKKKKDSLEIIVQAEISYSEQNLLAQQITDSFIGEFQEYVNQRCLPDNIFDLVEINTQDFENEYISSFSDNQSNDENQFFTVTGSINSYLNKTTQAKKPQESIMLGDLEVSISQILQSNSLLNHKFPNEPLKKKQPQFVQSHPSWFSILNQDWYFDDEGAIVNGNTEMIKVQNSVLKLVFQKIGKNLLAGKSILSMSLPVQVFGTQSNLQIIAKKYVFAPLILQKAAVTDDPVERIKLISPLLIGNILAQLGMQKPFNPILGQTYQGIVDGCPIYGEQTSHHPPISSIYMVGRGYKIYGSFQGKVSLGLNSATGENEGYNHIVFDKYPGEIKVNGTQAKLHGLMYGTRRVELTGKTFLIDKQNLLFAQLKWGKSHKSTRKDIKGYLDSYSGKLVKLKVGTDMTKQDKIKNSSFQTQYGELYGRVKIGAFFQSQQLFNTSKDLPHKVYDYQPCLMSDYRWREDLVMRKLGNYTRSQQQKQRLEQKQRRDRKLRAQYMK